MKEITLSKGEVVLVDDEDYEYLKEITWRRLGRYAVTSVRHEGKNKNVYMHKMIMRAGRTQIVDHKNHNTLDNRKENLRYATKAENQQNHKVRSNNTTGYKGVWVNKKTGKFVAEIGNKNGVSRHIRLGTFSTAEEAALAYNIAALEQFGQFAYLNRMKEEKQ